MFVLFIYLYPRKDLVPTQMISDTILFFSVFSKMISDKNKLSIATIQGKIENTYLITTSY